MKLITRLLLVALFSACLQAVPQSAFAQRDAGAKARGDSSPFWSSKSAGRSVQHARDYSVGAHQYIQSAPKPSTQFLRADAVEVGRNIEAAKAEVVYLKKNTASDKEVAAAVASIEKHLEAAHGEHHKFHTECAKDSLDAKVTMACCTALTEHLTKAHDELEALQKKLAPKTAAPKN